MLPQQENNSKRYEREHDYRQYHAEYVSLTWIVSDNDERKQNYEKYYNRSVRRQQTMNSSHGLLIWATKKPSVSLS